MKENLSGQKTVNYRVDPNGFQDNYLQGILELLSELFGRVSRLIGTKFLSSEKTSWFYDLLWISDASSSSV